LLTPFLTLFPLAPLIALYMNLKRRTTLTPTLNTTVIFGRRNPRTARLPFSSPPLAESQIKGKDKDKGGDKGKDKYTHETKFKVRGLRGLRGADIQNPLNPL